MTYQETLDYMFSQLPMFHRVGKSAYKANLDNTLILDEHFGHPHANFKTIHVAGTNGKGSTSHMLASILQDAGLKVGLYTSPHLRDFRERIKVNGEEVSEAYVVDFVEQHKALFEKVQPSFFEMTVALAFKYFADEQIDVAVVEVGMGGRLDSTNIISPLVSIITNIGFDHTEFLGDTLAKIAFEKGGIIKSQTPVVIGETHPETAPVFTAIAEEKQTSLVFADQKYRVGERSLTSDGLQRFTIVGSAGDIVYKDVEVDLQGSYQAKNILGVLAAVDVLKAHFPSLTDDAIRQGLRHASSQTGLRGRWFKLSDNPLTICDTGHNVDGITYIVDQISKTPHEKLYWVFGMVSDKDIKKVIGLLPKDAYYIFTQASIPRAKDADLLAEECRAAGLVGEVEKNVQKALEKAKSMASPNDLVFIGGSTFVVAEVV
jgi:folylpolyglutamate synthase/dihydrofolate synthase